MNIVEIIRQYRAIIIWGTIALAVFAAILAGYNFQQHLGKVGFELSIVPADASVKMNNVAVSSGTYYLLPGQYTIAASKTGFADYKKIIWVDDSSKKRLAVPLVPISKDAETWVKQHKDEYQSAVKKLDDDEASELTLVAQKNPILSHLPYSNYLFDINYAMDTTDPTGSRIILFIKASEGYKRSAFEKIKEWGYDPTDFKVQFVNYVSPFAS